MTKVAARAGCVAALMLTLWASVSLAQTTFRPGALVLRGPGSSIGVSVADRSDDASKAGAEAAGGVVIQEVFQGSPAARAGFRPGDIVVEFDGERLRSARQFSRVVQETRPDRPVKATVVREGSRVTLDVTPESGRAGVSSSSPFTLQEGLTLRTVPPALDLEVFPRDGWFSPSGGRLGAAVMALDDQLASYFGVAEGVLVTSVGADSAASRAGLKAGDVIVAIGGRTVAEPDEVTGALAAAGPGAEIDIRVMRDKQEVALKATLPGSARRRAAEPRVTI